MPEASEGKTPPQMASALFWPVGVSCTLSSPQTGQLSHQCCSLVKTEAEPQAFCTPRRKAGSGWLYPREAVLFLAENHASQTSVRQADCSPGLSWAPHLSCYYLSNQPLLSVLPLISRWQQTQQQRQLQAGGSRASCVFDDLESWQTQLIWRAHKGSAQAAAKRQHV